MLRGYAGDRNKGAVFSQPSLFDVLGKGYQRPFELATRRLDNMMKILPKCITVIETCCSSEVGVGGSLCPTDTSLLTWQGGTLLFEGDAVRFEHRDRGILTQLKIEDLMAALRQS